MAAYTSEPLIYDISRTITPDLAVWPGDATYDFQHALRVTEGASVNLTTMTLSPHTGSHTDAPYHIRADGTHPAALDVRKYLGLARVVSITRRHGGIVPADLEGTDLGGVSRLLIHTWVSNVPDHRWPEDFPHPTLELIDWLIAQGLVLLGVDVPSVDAFDSKDLPCHHRLFERGVVNLENLRLAGVPDGLYELIALPLKLDGVCGSPVRAILRTWPGVPNGTVEPYYEG